MVNIPNRKLRGGFTLIEAIVSMILTGIIFTGIMATSTITMERISRSLRNENEERQMDRAQLEISYFLSRAAEYRIFSDQAAARAATPTESESGNYLEIRPQVDPLEPLDIEKVSFSFDEVGGGENPSFGVEVTRSGGGATFYTYSHNIKAVRRDGSGADARIFWRRDDGFIEYQWQLDSGYGIESFSNMAIPRASL